MAERKNTYLTTRGIVLRRTNYGEADRILLILTPEGVRSVIARGVRKEKSKLAGGIELFSISEVTIREGRGELDILTSAKLVRFFEAFVGDIELMELGGRIVRSAARLAENADAAQLFAALEQSLSALQQATQNRANQQLIWVWWVLNSQRAAGAEPNLHFDTDGERLAPGRDYVWDAENEALSKAQNGHGRINEQHIKLLRLMLVAPVETALRVQNTAPLLDELHYIAKCLEKSII